MDKPDNLYDEALIEMKKETPDMAKAFELLLASYDLGGHKAAYAIGTWYLHGRHVKKDPEKAVDYFNVAIKKNIPNACYDLALCYETGTGVKKDLKMAFELYMRAALFGDSQSYYEVGRCYYHGIGVTKNKKLSNIWLDKAEDLGIKDKGGEDSMAGQPEHLTN
jgi:TPR repeat protein